MNHRLIERGTATYLEVFSRGAPIRTEEDALELVALCGEHDTQRLMLHGAALSEEFFRLRTRVAGAVLQKLVNYAVKTAIVLPPQPGTGERFLEWVSEANRGGAYRFFGDAAEAERWLLKGG